jgi:hypothetical protein
MATMSQHRPNTTDDLEVAGRLAHHISIPATWFNDNWGADACRPLGLNERTTYFVAVFVGTTAKPLRMLFRIIMDASIDPDYGLTANTAAIFHATWKEHGERRVPYYSLTTTDATAMPDPTELPIFQLPDQYAGMTTKPWDWRTLHATPDERGLTEPQSVYYTLQHALDVMLASDHPRLFMPWKNNNCHVDTWFAVQLAFYTFDEASCPGPPRSWPDAHRRMFRVLSCITDTKIADANRDLYLKYEKQATQKRGHAQTDDYSRHTTIMARFAQREGKPAYTKTRADRLIGVYVTTPCTVCPAETTKPRLMWQESIPGGRLWWPTCDQDLAIRDDTGYVIGHADTTATANKHKTMEEAVLSHLHRNDFSQVNCGLHGARSGASRPDAYTVKIKVGANARLPRFLEIDNGDMGISYPAPGTSFSAGNGLSQFLDMGDGLRYRLIALTYYNISHYVASVLLNGTWYRYNDMGHPTGPNTPRTAAHLQQCRYEEACIPPPSFHHRSYVFALQGSVHNSTTQHEALKAIDWKPYFDPMFGNLSMLAGSDADDDINEDDSDGGASSREY